MAAKCQLPHLTWRSKVSLYHGLAVRCREGIPWFCVSTPTFCRKPKTLKLGPFAHCPNRRHATRRLRRWSKSRSHRATGGRIQRLPDLIWLPATCLQAVGCGGVDQGLSGHSRPIVLEPPRHHRTTTSDTSSATTAPYITSTRSTSTDASSSSNSNQHHQRV